MAYAVEMGDYFKGSKVIYIRECPHIMVGKSLFALCRLCGEPVDDRQKKSARLHKKCADLVSNLNRRKGRGIDRGAWST